MGDSGNFWLIELVFYVVNLLILAWNLPIWVTLLVLPPLTLKIYSKLTIGMCKSHRRIDGHTAIVTGANIGIGLETAKDLARRGGRVIIACRDQVKGQAAVDEITQETGSKNVVLKRLDLCSLASVRQFSKEIIVEEARLDVLVHNAALLSMTKNLTVDKLESNVQTNHFGPFLLTNLLLEKLRASGNGRVVIVSSIGHILARSVDLDDLNSEKKFEPNLLYNRTKLYNLFFMRELNRRLQAAEVKGITVNALHPGNVRSALGRHLKDETWYSSLIVLVITFFAKSPLEGAQTSIHVAVSEELEGITGEYYSDCKVKWTTALSKDPALARKLWEESVKFTGLKPEETIVW